MTKPLNLMLHCGAKSLDLDELRAAPTPEPVHTHHPIPHVEIVDNVTRQLESTGFDVVQQAHGVTRTGDQYFGMLQARDSQADDGIDHDLVIGLRNSHNKTFPAGLAVGAGVFVCDNLSFSGEIVIARKHTRYILRDIPALVDRGMGRLGDYRHTQEKRITAYKEHALTDSDVNDVIFAAADARIIGTRDLLDVRREWLKPSHAVFRERSAWSLFNAFTEVFKPARDGSVYAVNRTRDRSLKLHGMMDRLVSLA